MYEKDPRRDWVASMPYKPWELIDLSPPELEALVHEATTGSKVQPAAQNQTFADFVKSMGGS